MKFSRHLISAISAALPIAAQSLTAVTTQTLNPFITEPTLVAQDGCPTVTETAETCATCPALQCITISTLTHSCGCPTPALTAFLNFPCKGVCGRVGCSTSYTVLPGEVSCGSDSASATGVTASATLTPTETVVQPTTATGASDPGTGGGGQSATTAAAATPNAAGRVAVPFKFW
ncbi:hypothetical protein C8035_v001471 [Colletotrichum spinosum]|uniref:Uncharacterized protein n=1 Tax=Colletotrichum spinosum TaxID=1347390 RepID=A0A4R8PYR0_9PEZI|nr:hypothetical protein C8035_v001471 [Colletotrichum spinosum]